jgi:23S rRNA-/tRNA-specific pseudouridylate synthase
MSSAPSTTGLRNVLGRVGQFFQKPNKVPDAPISKVMVRPTVPPTTRWTTGQISVTKADSQRRLTDMLCRQYDVSRAFVYRLLREGKVTVMRAREMEVQEGEKAGIAEPSNIKHWAPRENMRVLAGDLITLTEIILPPRNLSVKPAGKELSEKVIEFMKSLVIYKDERIIVINKPSDLAVHSGPGITTHIEGWLEALQYEAEIPPLIVHRLDRGTSGALLLARTREVAAQLSERFRDSHLDKGIEKVYWAMVRGKPDRSHKSGEIVTNIYKAAKAPNERMTSFADRRAELLDEGKVAITRYRWLQVHEKRKPVREKLSLMELTPITGRKHQLRVHLAEQLKLPVLGDYRYFRNQLPSLKLHLHCYRITLRNWWNGNNKKGNEEGAKDGEGEKSGKGGESDKKRHLTIKASIPKHFIETMNEYPLKLNQIPKFALKNKK